VKVTVDRVVYAVATMDTKGEEIAFVRDCLLAAGTPVRTVDVGTHSAPTVEPDVTRAEVSGTTNFGGENADRGQAVTAMSQALTEYLLEEESADRVAGVIGIGGSGGTALITAAMRSLPVGTPKVMVSTVASGNTAPYVDCSDITMMYSVVDIAGLNDVSRRVLANAAHAMAGMVRHTAPLERSRPAVGMTMFGVTTPCVTAIRQALTELGFDCLVFHATGTGGRAMEKLVESGLIQGVLDITTTEVADEIVGGVFAAGPNRFDQIIDSRIPYVMSLGALDMVNFGAMETVEKRFAGRRLHVHNAQVTLMRTTAEENREIARWIARKLNRATAPLVVLIPERGVSMIDAPGQPFYDPAVDACLFDELEACVHQDEIRRIVRLPYHINHKLFAERAVREFLDLQPAARRNGVLAR
jgi:uncharacterized protein (UPF0261 family)